MHRLNEDQMKSLAVRIVSFCFIFIPRWRWKRVCLFYCP